MTKHIKKTAVRPAENPKHENWKRRLRRKRVAAAMAAERREQAGMVFRLVAAAHNGFPQVSA
jgi:hypothetical protein